MVIILLLIALVIILPLAVQRNDLKRIALIAVCLEVLKIAFAWLVMRGCCNNEALAVLLVFFYFTALLPEMLVAGEHGPLSLLHWLVMLGAGIIWNLIPAYIISLFLPERMRQE